jgi:hypothetical protein
MTEETKAMLAPRMQWSLGGWLGCQLGGSLWMLIAGLLALPRTALAGAIVLGLFAGVNLLGGMLWRRREKLSPHPALQVLLVVLGASGAAAIYALDRAGTWESIQIGAHVAAGPSYLVLAAVILVLMLAFYLRFGRSTQSAQGPPR